LEDKKGLVKIGNERVISARLSDAKFFWEKNKAQSLVKQVGNLKSINFFSKLGTMFHKVQRIRKLGTIIMKVIVEFTFFYRQFLRNISC